MTILTGQNCKIIKFQLKNKSSYPYLYLSLTYSILSCPNLIIIMTKKIILCLFKRKNEWCALNSARPRFVKHQNQFVLTKRNRHNENDHTLSGDFHRQDQRRSHN